MKNIYPQNLKLRFPYPELALNFIAIIALALGHESVLLSAGIIVFLCIHSIMLWVKAGTSRAYLQLKRHKHISQQRLKLIREIIGLSVYYEGYSKEWLHKKFCETVCAKKLLHASVLDIDKERHDLKASGKARCLTKDEALFYCLMEAGFSMRELSVMFHMKNYKSSYVKRKRILDKTQ